MLVDSGTGPDAALYIAIIPGSTSGSSSMLVDKGGDSFYNVGVKEEVTRQLAAVMFADIVGYTAMMQADEQNAILIRNRHKKILDEMILKHQGRLLQYYGDGSLSTFRSAIDAVSCALEIQGQLRKAPQVPLRIGIHTGDIVFDGEGIYGDGVNVASRVESLAASGGVLVSDKVFDDIKNHPEFSVTSLGRYELKNVKRPVELYALTNHGLPVPTPEEINSGKSSPDKTIAVLPFINMSTDPENEYFSEGISEEIINVLTKIEGLHVTARTSSFAFKGKNLDIRQIGKQLGVSVILEGSVRKAGNRVRITAQLIDTHNGFHIFSEDYDRDLEDIFALQDEIALLIANRLRENYDSGPERLRRKNAPTQNAAAYDMYLKGLHQMGKGSYEGTMACLPLFKHAIDMDANFALPYTSLSFAYLFLGASRYADQTESFSKAQKYAELAEQIDDQLPETHLALARTYFFSDWDFKKANKAVERALELGPGSAKVHSTHALFLLIQGHLETARIEAETAIHSDPYSLFSYFVLGSVYYSCERYEEAVEQCDKALEKLPSFQQAHVIKSKALLCTGDTARANEAFKNVPDSPNHVTLQYATMSLIYKQQGETEKILQCLDKIKEQERAGIAEFVNWSYTLVYMALDDTDKMFRYLRKCYDQKAVVILFLNVDPLFKKYRNDSRFIDLVNRTLGRGKTSKWCPYSKWRDKCDRNK